MWRLGAQAALKKTRSSRPLFGSNSNATTYLYLGGVRSFERDTYIKMKVLNKYGHFQNDIDREYKKVRYFLKCIDTEPYGSKDRGLKDMFELLRPYRDKLVMVRRFLYDYDRRTMLNSLLYDRHALRHGAIEIEEMSGVDLAKSLLGNNIAEGAEISLDEAKLIIRELWRYNESPWLEELKVKYKKDKKSDQAQEKESKNDTEEKASKTDKEEKEEIPEKVKELLYERHALRFNNTRLEDMSNSLLAKTFFGKEAEAEMSLDEAKLILCQLWQSGNSPLLNELQAKYINEQEDQERKDRELKKALRKPMSKAKRRWLKTGNP